MLEHPEKFKLKESYVIQHPAFAIYKIGNNAVQIGSRQVLDREKVSRYQNVKIIDTNSNSEHTKVVAILDVQVQDVNDNLPVFNLTSTRLVWNIKPIEAIKYAILGEFIFALKIHSHFIRSEIIIFLKFLLDRCT